MVVSELFAKLGLSVDEASFKKGEVVLGGLRTALGAIGLSVGAAASGLAAMVVKTAHAGDAAVKASQRLGMTTDAVQELGYAAGLSGSSAEELEGGLGRLARTASDAARGSELAKRGFATVGVAATDGSGALRPIDEILADVADKFAAMEDGTKKAAVAQELFGRGGARLIPLLNEGREGLAKLRQEARDLGIVLDAETAAASVEFADNLDRAKQGVKGLTFAIGGPLIHAFDEGTKTFVEWVKANRAWIAAKVHAAIDLFTKAWRVASGMLGPIVKLLLALISNAWVLKGALAALAVVIAAQLGASLKGAIASAGKFLTLIRSITLAQVGAGAAAVATGLAWAAAFALVIALIEELYGWFTGDRETLLEEWLGPFDEFKKKIADWFNVSDNGLVKIARAIRDFFREAAQYAREVRAYVSGDEKSKADAAAALEKRGAVARTYAKILATPLGGMLPGGHQPATLEEMAAQDPLRVFKLDAWTAPFRTPAQPAPAPVAVTFGDINVTAPPGGDPDEFAKKVREAVGEEVDEKLRGILDPAYEAVTR